MKYHSQIRKRPHGMQPGGPGLLGRRPQLRSSQSYSKSWLYDFRSKSLEIDSRNSNNRRIRWIMWVWTCIIERDNPYLDVKKNPDQKIFFYHEENTFWKFWGDFFFFKIEHFRQISKLEHFQNRTFQNRKSQNLKIENFQKLSPQNEKSSLSKLVCFRPYSIQSMPIAS